MTPLPEPQWHARTRWLALALGLVPALLLGALCGWLVGNPWLAGAVAGVLGAKSFRVALGWLRREGPP